MRGNQLVHARAEPADSRGNRAQLFARRALEALAAGRRHTGRRHAAAPCMTAPLLGQLRNAPPAAHSPSEISCCGRAPAAS